jgi:hypothetical protein
MKRLQLSISEDTYNKIKAKAKLEKRSVTNYLDMLLTSLFSMDENDEDDFEKLENIN